MKSTISKIIIAVFASFYLMGTAIASLTPLELEIQKWHSGKPVKHGPVRDQDSLGVCWAYSTASYFENKILNETGNLVEISPLYFARSSILDEIKASVSELNLFLDSQFRNDPLVKSVTKVYRNKHALEIAADIDQGGFSFLPEAMMSGAVPMKNYERSEANGHAPYRRKNAVSLWQGRFSLSFYDSIKSVFLDGLNEGVLEKTGELKTIVMKKVDDYFDANTLDKNTEFTFDGKSYSPLSFLYDYLKFQPAPEPESGVKLYPLMRVNVKSEIDLEDFSFQKDLDQITYNLEKGYAVPISFRELSDLRNYQYSFESTGVFDLEKCLAQPLCGSGDKNNCIQVDFVGAEACYQTAGHAALIVNTMTDEKGRIKAFIIQNSWGRIGRDDFGQLADDPYALGFNILPIDYLVKTYHLDKTHRAFSYYPTVFKDELR